MVVEIVASVAILIVGVTLFVLIHVCIIGRTFSTITSGASMQGTILISRIGSMSQEDIKKLPSYDFNMEEQKSLEISTSECVVCLEKFKSGEKCKLLPSCNHSFHCECIDSWLIKTGACPICRALVDIGREEGSFSGEVGLELR
ncbi:Zinc finger, RING/FYVE/PHD-type [Artemisia annua]|uniref:Zinc finger, RING/FYVE/PHD-type n=1 Tax=Artemisia annua TaxID=35608 RepID=A0A2U1MUY5_ARTAN|nr:Zinc finger, RING/FYVE/PHD-type [Artemisia annua]